MKFRFYLKLSQEQEIEIIQSLRRRYQKKLEEAINRKSSNDEQSIKDCIELAEIKEEEYTKSGQTFNIPLICREIARDYKSKGVKTWNHVYDYLPEKYKDPRAVAGQKRRWAEFEADVNPLNLYDAVQNDDKNQLEQLKEQLNEIVEKIPKEQIPDTWKILKNATTEMAEKAEEKGVSLISTPQETGWTTPDKEWPKISTIEPPKTDPEVLEIINAKRKEMHRVIDEAFDEFARFWPQAKEHVPRFVKGLDSILSLFRWLNDDKYSLDVSEWFDRMSYERAHGKHAAAVWQKAQTILCKKCSSNVLEDEDDYEVMTYDPDSESGWRCPKCHGTEQFERAMTREQIGDRREYIWNFANYIIDGLLDGWSFMAWWYRHNKKGYNTARKPRLFNELSSNA